MQRIKKIDIHVHSVPTPVIERLNSGFFATPSQLRYMYDQIGVEKGLLLSINAGAGEEDSFSNRESISMVRDFPDTLGWWFCSMSPNMGQNMPDTDLSFYMKQYIAHGAKGIGEITENRYMDDPFMLNLYQHAQDCGLPITIHIGKNGGDYGLIDELGLPRLELVLNRYPKLTILGHSQKFWAEISGDLTEEQRNLYPTGKVVPGGRIVQLMREYPNLCGDLSAGSGYNAVSRDPDFGYAFIEEFQDQLFYGTDICDPRNITSPMLKLAEFLDSGMEQGRISYDAYVKVSRGNALRLLED